MRAVCVHATLHGPTVRLRARLVWRTSGPSLRARSGTRTGRLLRPAQAAQPSSTMACPRSQPTRQHEHEKDQDDETHSATGHGAPARAVRPGRQHADQQQDQDDRQDGAQTDGLVSESRDGSGTTTGRLTAGQAERPEPSVRWRTQRALHPGRSPKPFAASCAVCGIAAACSPFQSDAVEHADAARSRGSACRRLPWRTGQAARRGSG
jgi:hypothetical protein